MPNLPSILSSQDVAHLQDPFIGARHSFLSGARHSSGPGTRQSSSFELGLNLEHTFFFYLPLPIPRFSGNTAKTVLLLFVEHHVLHQHHLRTAA